MASGSFQFRYNHQNENAAWYTNPDTKFALPDEDVDLRCDDPYLNENQFLELVRRFFFACGYTEQQWVNALSIHLSEVNGKK